MRSVPVPAGSALLVMLAVWTVLSSGSMVASLIGEEPATLLVFCLSAALLIVTRRPAVVRPRLRDAALLALTITLGFAGHPPLGSAIAVLGLALGLDPSLPAPPIASGLPLLIAVVVAAPVFEELLYRERLLDAIAATRLRTGGAILLTSALFALPHLTPWQILGSFVVGVALALVRHLSGALTACIGLHAGLNLRSVCDCTVEALHG
jgi:membrane protease YdiL (CAAX protease family)